MTSQVWLPREKEELMELLKQGARPVAGGTDYFIGGHRGDAFDLAVLTNMKDMGKIEEQDEQVVVGAVATMRQLHQNSVILRHAQALAMAAVKVGSVQIRNAATLGGNLANLSPAADTPVALLALDAVVTLSSSDGDVMVPIQDLIQKKVVVKSDQVIWNFHIPKKWRHSAFVKLGSRREVTISRLNVAVSWNQSEARVAVGTLGNCGRLCLCAADSWIANNFAAFEASLSEFVEDCIPGRSTLAYKRRSIVALAQDLWRIKESYHD